MAQKKPSSKTTTSKSTRPASRAGGSSAARTGTKTSSAKSAPRSSGAKKPASATARGSAAQSAPAVPIRREVWGFVLLFLSLIFWISCFQKEHWLLRAAAALGGGLFGWGGFVLPAALTMSAGILLFHRGRPVTGRLVCCLLVPMVFGAFIHAVLADKDLYLMPALTADGFGAALGVLWQDGALAATRCGGVLAGLFGAGLVYLISVWAAVPVLVVVLVLLVGRTLNITVEKLVQLWYHVAERPRADYVPAAVESVAEEDIAAEEVEELLYPVEGGLPIRRRRPAVSDYDLPVDDGRDERIDNTPPAERPAASSRRRKKEREDIFSAFGVDDAAPSGAAERDDFSVSSASTAAPIKAPSAPRRKKSTAPSAPSAPVAEAVPMSIEEAEAFTGTAAPAPAAAQSDAPPAGGKTPSAPKEKIDRDAEAALVAAEIEDAAEEEKPAYIFPPMELLRAGTASGGDSRDEILQMQQLLASAIGSFGVEARMTEITHGPTVTRYDLELSRGVKLSKLTNLSDDLALSLGVTSVRIAPIPDKISTVGIEVPNRNINTVWLSEIVGSDTFRKAESRLSFAIGKDIGGHPVVGNISKLPHLLIAGTTGSGKSVCINSLILSLLYKSTPDEVRMIMIDPKMVELGIYNGMPHLYVPVVTDPKKAAGALQWAVVEMLKRYRLFSEVGVRDLNGYNNHQRAAGDKPLPAVVIIIDELADLMMVASKEVEESICRVAQMGRAAGMHLVIATQRPSADVITGLMKANIPSRIAFAVSSSLESRIILDRQGAEKLIGSGDMLYCPLGVGKGMRVQGSFVTDEERERIVEFVKSEASAEYSEEVLAEIERAAAQKDKNAPREEEDSHDAHSDYDELLPDAVDVVFEAGQASVSMLQRRLKLGYARAARIVDQMEQLGVLGPYEGAKPRKLMITKQQWQQMQYSTGVAPTDSLTHELSELAQAAAEEDAFAPLVPEEGVETAGISDSDDLLPADEDFDSMDGEDSF